MKLESKIKKVTEVREYVSEHENGINIRINDITRNDNNEMLNINNASIFKDSECVGDFSIYGEYSEIVDNRRFMLNIPFELINHIDKIINSITSIDKNEYENVKEFSYEKRERKLREEMINKQIYGDASVQDSIN